LAGAKQWIGSFGVAHPGPLSWLVALAEFGGGLLVLLGFLTSLGAALTISVMGVAIIEVHSEHGFFNTEQGYEFNLALITLALTLMLVGAGAISIDQQLALLLIPLAGLFSVELSRRAAGAPEARVEQE